LIWGWEWLSDDISHGSITYITTSTRLNRLNSRWWGMCLEITARPVPESQCNSNFGKYGCDASNYYFLPSSISDYKTS
jgi:hypothetical protein